MNRRQFTRQTAMASAMALVSAIPGFTGMLIPPSRDIKKGIMWGSLGVGKTIAEKFQAAKVAGCNRTSRTWCLRRNALEVPAH
jgi:hypothetical protein